MNETMRVTVIVEPPDGGRIRRESFEVSREVWQESFAPLPRDREILPDAAREAREMQARRQQLAGRIGEQIAARLLAAAEAADPVNGYEPEQARRCRSCERGTYLNGQGLCERCAKPWPGAVYPRGSRN